MFSHWWRPFEDSFLNLPGKGDFSPTLLSIAFLIIVLRSTLLQLYLLVFIYILFQRFHHLLACGKEKEARMLQLFLKEILPLWSSLQNSRLEKFLTNLRRKKEDKYGEQ